MITLFIHIGLLVQVREHPVLRLKGNEMNNLPCIPGAYLLVNDGKIEDFGSMQNLNINDLNKNFPGLKTVDVKGGNIFPCWVDSHTHLVFSGWREGEFSDRIRGLSYEEIAIKGGGILNSARKLNQASEDELFESAMQRLNEVMLTGTGTIEIKSGYGLTTEGELKMLRVIQKLKKNSPLTIQSTFLGAHAVPEIYRHEKEKYIALIINEMLPQIAEEKLADYCDVFCERNYFTRDESIRIFEAAARFGIKAKVHANQLSNSGGVQAGVACHAVSVDHLEYVGDEEIICLLHSETMPVLLPGAAFFLSLPDPPARKMIESGLPVAVASDYNPGSSPSGNMNFMIALLCIRHKLTPEEAINAATINGAAALNESNKTGCIAKGYRADFFISHSMPSYAFIPYAFTHNPVERVYLKGIEQNLR